MKMSAAPLLSSLHRNRRVLANFVTALLLHSGVAARADQIEMQNGDRYVGTVVSLDADTLVMQNDVLGSVRLPRTKVLSISFEQSGSRNPSPMSKTNAASSKPALNSTNLNSGFNAAVRQLNDQTNLIQQVQGQFLSDAGPEANNKFNEMLNGLVTGKFTLGDLRKEAKSAADQLRALKKDLGDDSGFAVDGYLSILDSFLDETGAAENPPTTSTNKMKMPSPAVNSTMLRAPPSRD